MRLDNVQADEGVVAVQGSQQQVHPLYGGPDTEWAQQVSKGGLGEESTTFKLRDQETHATLLQHHLQPLRWRFIT